MKHPITPNGHQALQRELKKLKAMRPELSRAIEVARAHGDISENADYDAAKNKSGMVEAKIRDLENRLASCEVLDPQKVSSLEKIVFGLSARVADMDSGEEKTFTIVDTTESDADKGRISYESPIGRSLIGKQVGDVVKTRLPAGMREFEILEIFCDYKPEQSEEVSE